MVNPSWEVLDNPLAIAEERLMLLSHVLCPTLPPLDELNCYLGILSALLGPVGWLGGLGFVLDVDDLFYESIVMPLMYPTIPLRSTPPSLPSRYSLVEPFIIVGFCALAPCLHPHTHTHTPPLTFFNLRLCPT